MDRTLNGAMETSQFHKWSRLSLGHSSNVLIVSLFSTWVICQSTTIWCCGLCRKRTLSTRVYWQTNVWTTWCMYSKMVSGNWDPEQCTAKWTNSFRSWRLEQKHSLKYVGGFFRFNFPAIFFFRKSSFS